MTDDKKAYNLLSGNSCNNCVGCPNRCGLCDSWEKDYTYTEFVSNDSSDGLEPGIEYLNGSCYSEDGCQIPSVNSSTGGSSTTYHL